MSDTTEAALVGLRERLRDLELDACAVRSRVEEVRSLIELLEHGTRRRPGRPRSRSTVVEMPERVEGGTAGAGYRDRGDGTLAAPIATEETAA